MFRPLAYGLAFQLCAIGSASAEDAKATYPAMAPLAQYQMETVANEAALARSAAPTSISGDADVLTLGSNGYKTAVKGKNGFVCLVQRSWAAGFDDAESGIQSSGRRYVSTPPPCAPFSPAISREHSGFSPAFQSPA